MVNSISKASLASVVAAVNNAASSYSTSLTSPGMASGAGTDSHGMNISVLNSRNSNLITLHSQEAGGPAPPYPGSYTAPPSSAPTYPPAYPAAPSTYPNLSQPPPTYTAYPQVTAASAYPGYSPATPQPTPGYPVGAGPWSRPPPPTQPAGYYRR